jgi:iron(III) transport system substrate-binding protein
VLGYDSRVVKESDLPKSVFDLTKPRWKGKVGWAPTNASFQSFVTAMRLEKGDQATLDWLEAMKANGVQPYEKNSQIRDAVANGEIEVGLINHYYVLEAINEGEADGKTYPVKIHFFPGGDVGSLVNVAGIGVLKSASNPKGAELFTDYVLSKKGQEYFATKTGEYPLAKGIDPDPSLPSLDRIQSPSVDLAGLADLEGTLALMRKAGVL